jgi:alanine racemase
MAKILLNKDNLFHNLSLISKKAGSKDKVAVTLKDNAYGHGLVEIAQLASEFGIKKAVVRTIDDAMKIKEYFEYILILADNTITSYSDSFHVALNSFESIDRLPDNINAQIKVDTGMHRNGILPSELEKTVLKLLEKKINITGVFTHHKSADDILSNDFDKQNTIFAQVKEEVKQICEKLSITLPAFHSSNSSALFRHESMDESFARVGIATYGYLESNDKHNIPPLKPVMSLWTNKVSSRVLEKGETVGYGGTYTTDKNITISTYDIGYGDGFLRLNEKHNYITPKGFKLLGRVSMDYISLNSDDNEVCLFDDVRSLANLLNTISYEIVTTLSRNLKKEIK